MERSAEKSVIRAVIAALFLLVGIFISLLSARQPLKVLEGVGDVYLLLNKGLAVEGRILDSDLYKSLTNRGDDTAKYLFALNEGRKSLREEMGGYFDFIGFNFKVASAFSGDGSMIVAINPGVLAPFGGFIFRKAGFEDAGSLSGVLGKGDVFFFSEDGFWFIGNSAGIEKQMAAKEKERNKLWSSLIGEIDYNKPVNLVLQPSGLARMSEKILGGQFTAVLEDWTALSVWDGATIDLDVEKEELSIKMKILVGDSPLSKILPMLGEENYLTEWVVAQTVGGGAVSIPKLASFWRKVKDAYSNRPMPREFLKNLEEELNKELGVDIAELAENLKGEIGFVNLNIAGKNKTILLAGARKGLKEYIRKKENDIPGEWRSVFKLSEIRYMKRLLAYTVMDDKLIIAAGPDVMESYLEAKKSGKNKPHELMRILDGQKDDSLSFGGILLEETQSATVENKTGKIFYGVGFKKDGGKILGEITLRGLFGDATKPSFKCRMWMAGGWLLNTFLIMAMIYAVCAFAFNITLIKRLAR